MVLSSCSEKTVSRAIQDDVSAEVKYSDDLSKYRPTLDADIEVDSEDKLLTNIKIESKYDISSQFDLVLDTIAARNKEASILKGYTILVYSGINERDAGRVRNRLFDILPEMQAVLQYKLPTYYVKVGRFYQQIEAQPLYEKIKNYYPNATVVPEQFKLNK